MVDDTKEFLTRGVALTIENVARDLEMITKRLARMLPPLDGTKLPEYQKALESIRVYKDALVDEINSLYKQQE